MVVVGRFLWTRPPVAEDQGQIERPNHAITVKVRRMPAVRAPEAQHQRQIKRAYVAVAVEILGTTEC